MAKIKLVFEDIEDNRVKISVEGENMSKMESINLENFIDELTLAEQLAAFTIAKLQDIQDEIKRVQTKLSDKSETSIKTQAYGDITEDEIDELFNSLDDTKKVIN